MKVRLFFCDVKFICKLCIKKLVLTGCLCWTLVYVIKYKILEVNMKNSQSKFSNDKSKSGTTSNPSSSSSSSSSGCCCGSKLSSDIDEIDVLGVEEK